MSNPDTLLALSAKSLADLVNQSLTLSEQDRMVAGATGAKGAWTSPSTTTTSADVRGRSSSPLPTSPERMAPDSTAASEEAQHQSATSSRLPLVGPPADKLISISCNMNSHLTTLLVSCGRNT